MGELFNYFNVFLNGGIVKYTFIDIFFPPVGVSVAHGVMARIVLVVFVHFKAHSFVPAVLSLVLVCLLWYGRGRGGVLE